MLHRRLGRMEFMGSVVMFGAASLGKVSQEEADRSIAYAFEHGINHFDTAASYGDAELRMGPSMPGIRDRIFLATKTGKKTREAAKRQLHESLEKLQVDSVDLIQLHGVFTLEDLDERTGAGGALEALIEARDEGLVRYIGITGHSDTAPATHLEALRRFPFDAVLTPYNYAMAGNPDYLRDFRALTEACLRDDVALRVIKAFAHRPWNEDEARKYATWYKPYDQQEIIDACVRYALEPEGVSALASAGDIHIIPKVIEAVKRYDTLSLEDAERTLKAAGPVSPFGGSTSIA